LAQPLEVIKALAILKKCAAKVNTEIAGLDEKIS
jgi:fumarate hydratase class II